MRLPKFFCKIGHQFTEGWGTSYSGHKGSYRQYTPGGCLYELFCFRCERYILVNEATYLRYFD